MTREEAINILDELSRTVTVAHSHKNVEAVHMAITALQQEEHLVELEAKAVAIIKSERHGEWEKDRLPTTKGGGYDDSM